METRLVLGRDHVRYGEVASFALGARLGCAISVGADPESPSLEFKGDPENLPNEDAVLVASEGARVLLAVADGHHGTEASHGLLAALQASLHDAGVPADLDALFDRVSSLPLPIATSDADPGPGAALSVLVADAAAGLGAFTTLGDTSLVRVHQGREQALGRKTRRYASLADPESLRPSRAVAGTFPVEEGDLLLAFTDGLDECHYGRPRTSVQARHRASLLTAAPTPAALADALAHLALAGVDGHPGGQDNVAVAVARP